LYHQLKEEYGNSLQTNKELQHELDNNRKELETLRTNMAEQQQQMNQLQQELETVRDIAVHDKQHFRTELDKFQQVHDDLIQQMEDSQEANRTLEKTMAILIVEKETNAKENIELKTVCDETMALLETMEKKQQQQQEEEE